MSKDNKSTAKKGTPLSGTGKGLREIGLTFTEGDWTAKLSFVIMGFGQLLHRQFLRGIIFLAIEINYGPF